MGNHSDSMRLILLSFQGYLRKGRGDYKYEGRFVGGRDSMKI
jgi:hypothetical protein